MGNFLAALKKLFTRNNTQNNPDEMNFLIVGLGNIGNEYHNTRHNIGFMVVDALAEAAGATWEDKRYGFVTEVRLRGH